MKKSISETMLCDGRAVVMRKNSLAQGGIERPNAASFAKAEARRKIEERRIEKEAME